MRKAHSVQPWILTIAFCNLSAALTLHTMALIAKLSLSGCIIIISMKGDNYNEIVCVINIWVNQDMHAFIYKWYTNMNIIM